MPEGMELRIFPYETQKKKDLGIQQNKKRRNEFEDMGGGGGGGQREHQHRRSTTAKETAHTARNTQVKDGAHKNDTKKQSGFLNVRRFCVNK